MIERQRSKGLCDLVLDAGDEQLSGIELLGNGLLQECRKVRHQFARLDDDTVAGGDRADRGRQRELQRIIPGRDDADHAERLRDQPVARGQELQRGRHALRRHPGLQVFCRMPDLGEHQHRLGDIGLHRRAVAEIGRDRLPEALLVLADNSAQPRQPVEALGQIRRRLGPRSRGHGVEGVRECQLRGARQGLVQGLVHGLVVHGKLHGAPPSNGVSPRFVAASWPFVELVARASQTDPNSVRRPVIKSKKTSLRPFPKAARVGTYRPHPTGFARGCLPRKPLGRTSKPRAQRRPSIHRPRHFSKARKV